MMPFRFRLARHAAVLAVLFAATFHQAQAGPPELEQIVVERAAAHGQDAGYLSTVIECESEWDTHAVGALGELGLAQLKPGAGELARFYRYGYSDPFSAYESIDYLALRFSEGGAGAWSCS